MKRTLAAVSFLSYLMAGAHGAMPACDFESLHAGPQQMGKWIDKSNWFAIENQGLTLANANVFMPALYLPANRVDQPKSVSSLSIDEVSAIDPLDGSQRDLAFLLDSRLLADGIVVLRNGRVVAERFRNGLTRDRPRLLMEATRPFLTLLGALSVSQGKLSADKSVVRHLPALAESTGLRKLSVQRLLESAETHAWSVGEVASWRTASGWDSSATKGGVRAWLSDGGRWNKSLRESTFGRQSTPEDDLLAWLLAESNGMPLARLFCEQLLSRVDRDDAVLWVVDPNGVELASGLALSLRDFAKLGQLLIEARISRGKTRIPGWFIETLLASSGVRISEIQGLAKGSEQRYGFVHLGGAPNRIALIGRQGTSLYIDFDKRLVVAMYGSRPGDNTPSMLALLEHTWRAVDAAVGVSDRQRAR